MGGGEEGGGVLEGHQPLGCISYLRIPEAQPHKYEYRIPLGEPCMETWIRTYLRLVYSQTVIIQRAHEHRMRN